MTNADSLQLTPENRRFDVVFWDFDGTMARTENLHVAAWQRAVSHVGIPFPRHAFAAAATDDDRQLLADLFARYQLQYDDALIYRWCRAKQQILVDMLRLTPVIYPGVAETVRQLASLGIEQAVVTNTWRENVTSALAAANLGDVIQTIIDKEDVLRTKPDPEPYHIAMARLQQPPRRCLAIEDSPTGIKSAVKAGLFVVAIAHPHSPAARREGSWSQGAPVVSDIREIVDFLSDSGR
jgi:HAD superfamily hydrolase (TIGR01509 family)